MGRSTGSGTVRRHVAVCAFPFGSHSLPLLCLVQRIAATAPDIRFTFFNTQVSNAKLFSATNGQAAPVHNIVPHTVHDGVPEGYVLSDPLGEAISLFLSSGEENFKKSMVEAEEEVGVEISCLVTDSFLWFCQKIAEEKGAAWIPLWAGGNAVLSAYLHADTFMSMVGDKGIEGHEDELLDFLPGFSKIRMVDLPEWIISDGLENTGFVALLPKMTLALPKATAVAINSIEELEPEVTNHLKERLQKVLNVGPFSIISPRQTTKPDEYGCLSWVERREPASVVYISFGTLATPPPNELEALAEALEESGVPFIWSLNAQAKTKLPQGFLARTRGEGKNYSMGASVGSACPSLSGSVCDSWWVELSFGEHYQWSAYDLQVILCRSKV
ncbi:hypothetical protein Ancab_028451 [Ancistrocladus abbreviatus]